MDFVWYACNALYAISDPPDKNNGGLPAQLKNASDALYTPMPGKSLFWSGGRAGLGRRGRRATGGGRAGAWGGGWGINDAIYSRPRKKISEAFTPRHSAFNGGRPGRAVTH